MLQAFLNIFKIADLRNKVLFTLSMLVIYRIGFWIPLIGVDQTELARSAEKAMEESQTGFARSFTNFSCISFVTFRPSA